MAAPALSFKKLSWPKWPRGTYWRNPLAVAGLVFVSFTVLVALLGYAITPDGTPLANRQHRDLARLAPGTTITFLQKKLEQPPGRRSFLARLCAGQPAQTEWLPLAPGTSPEEAGERFTYTTYRGLKAQVAIAELEANGRGGYTHTTTFWLGTDAAGRDVLSRLIIGSRISLSVGMLAVLISLVLGLGLGLTAGYFGGRWDGFVQWLMSVIWSLPSLLLAIALAFVLGRGYLQLYLAIGISMWVDVARIVRGEVLSIRSQTYVEAARVLGVPTGRLLVRHILPQLVGPVAIMAAANFATAILLEAGLSFLGLGLAPPTPSWGAMIQTGYPYLVTEHGKWLALVPGTAIVLLITSINLIGLGLRDAYDPKRRYQQA